MPMSRRGSTFSFLIIFLNPDYVTFLSGCWHMDLLSVMLFVSQLNPFFLPSM